MTIKQLKERGMKNLFLKEDTEKCEKWDLIAHFKLINNQSNNFIYKTSVDMKIYYYSSTECFVSVDCMKSVKRKNTYLTTEEIIKYEDFFNHIFDIDEYVR